MGQGLAEQFRAAIRSSGMSMYQIAKESGVDQMSISRFMSRARDIRLETADKLASVVGVKFTRNK